MANIDWVKVAKEQLATKDCAACDGWGVRPGGRCKQCKGTGRVPKDK